MGRRREILLELAGPALIAGLVTYFYGRLLLGEFPVSHDHPAHMFNAWLTSDVLLPSGRLGGWSELWFAGYPVNELYGPGGNLWVALFRYATFGQLPFGVTYGVALFFLMLLVPLSAWALGRALLGRTAGAVAGILMALTRGGWYDLGWFWILEMGVWPFALGAALTLIAIVVLRRYVRHGGALGLAAAGLAVATAILGHPMSLLLLGIAGPMVVLHVLLERGREGATRVLLRGAGAAGLGVGLCAFWLVPFVTRSAYTQKLGETWLELRETVPSLVQLDLFGEEWRLVLGVALAGFAIALARRNVWAIFLGTTGLLMALFASATTQYDLRLFDVLSPLASIQYPRFLGVVRVFAYALAGYAVAELWALAGPALKSLWAQAPGARARNAVLVALPLALSAPLLPAAGEYLQRTYAPKTGETLQTQRDNPWWIHWLNAAAWVRDALEGEPWSRVGAFGHPYDHTPSALPIWTGVPVYSGGFVPAHTYRFFFDGQRDTRTLRAVGVRYVIAGRDWARTRPDVAERAVFGPVAVYELLGAKPTRASPIGDCEVAVTEASEERLVVAVSGAAEPCRVLLHRSDFPNWQATFEGATLPIERSPTWPGSDYAAFMSVVAPRDGTITVAWTATPGDRVGAALSAVCWIGLALLLLIGSPLRRRLTLLDRLPSPGPRARLFGARVTWTVVAVLALAGLSLAVGRAQERAWTFDRHVGESAPEVLSDGRWVPCTEAEEGLGWVCGEDWDRVRAGLFSFVYDSRYCVYAHPSPRGPKRLIFRDVPLGDRLSGFYGLLDTSHAGSDVTMTVAVGASTPVELTAGKNGEVIGFEVLTEPGPADVTVTVEADPPQWRHFCFNAQVVQGE